MPDDSSEALKERSLAQNLFKPVFLLDNAAIAIVHSDQMLVMLLYLLDVYILSIRPGSIHCNYCPAVMIREIYPLTDPPIEVTK